MLPRSWRINRHAPMAFHEPTPRKGWEIRAAADSAEILLYGDIGWDIVAGEFVNELNTIAAQNITLRINSPGGFAFDGVAMYNGLVRHHARITVYVDGFAASAATIVMMAGDEIVAEPGAMLLIHNAWGGTVGDYRDHQAQADTLIDLCDKMADIYAARAGGTRDEWRAIMDAETRYTGERALEAGLVDRVNDPKARPEPAPAPESVSDDQLAAMSDRDAVSSLYAGRAASPPPSPLSPPSSAVDPATPTPPVAPAAAGSGWSDVDVDKLAAAFAAVRSPKKQEVAR